MLLSVLVSAPRALGFINPGLPLQPRPWWPEYYLIPSPRNPGLLAWLRIFCVAGKSAPKDHSDLPPPHTLLKPLDSTPHLA